MFRPANEYGGSSRATGIFGFQCVAAFRAAVLLNSLTTNGQSTYVALILRRGSVAATALFEVTRRPAAASASNTASSVAGSRRCGSGVITGVGAGVAGRGVALD